jgi:PhnB protein
MHAALNLGENTLMGADAPAEHFEKPAGFAVAIHTAEPDEAERIFNSLSENGKVTMPIQQTFWSVRFGMFVDRFGIPWMINCDQQP